MADLGPTAEDVRERLERGDADGLRDALASLPAPDVAAVLQELDEVERVSVFRLLPREFSVHVFAYLEPGAEEQLLEVLRDEEIRFLLNAISPDDRMGFLERLPAQAVRRMLNMLSPREREESHLLLRFPEESVGRAMTPDYVAVRPEWTIARSLEHIRTRGKDSETVNVIYVTDASWRLLDDLELRKFILADPETAVERLMDRHVISIEAGEDRERAAALLQRYDLVALPVVDAAGVLLGIVTADDILDIVREEATEDFQRSAAVEPLRRSYRETGVWPLYRKRIVWLLPLLGVNLLASSVVGAYEDLLASAITLAFFIPIIMGSGGNTGSQAATIIVRALATGDVRLPEWLRVTVKELAVGALLGLTMGAAVYALGRGVGGGAAVALAVCLAMLANVMVTNILGLTVPLVLWAIRVDPAVASSPLITSISDMTCLLIYFYIAGRVLGLI